MSEDPNKTLKDMMTKDVVILGRKGMTVTCVKCKREGSLTKRQTKSKGITYRDYYCVQHHIGKKIKWCYLGKFKDLPKEYQNKIRDRDTWKEQNSRTNEQNKK